MNNSIHSEGVRLGKNVVLEEFVFLGKVPDGLKNEVIETIIGNNSLIRSHTVIYMGNVIGSDFKTGHGVLIRENNIIGNFVSIGSHSVIEHDVIVEDNVRIRSQAFIPEYSVIKKNSWIGPNVVLTNAKYPLSTNVKKSLKGPEICENAIIGANSTILPGIYIGPNSLVGAGSVVTKNVEAGTVVAGNPAVKLKDVSELQI
ncbi:MAG: transferase [Candidatus Marinimicrobia bacterium]|nr:transferase [Candidatus Neomarinimicrobiota bacterium]